MPGEGCWECVGMAVEIIFGTALYGSVDVAGVAGDDPLTWLAGKFPSGWP